MNMNLYMKKKRNSEKIDIITCYLVNSENYEKKNRIRISVQTLKKHLVILVNSNVNFKFIYKMFDILQTYE